MGAVAAVIASTILIGCSEGGPSATPSGEGSGGSAPASVRVVTVGDIACDPGEEVTETTCQQQATADLTARLAPDLVLALGDLQYQAGSESEFAASWAESWGRFDDQLIAVPGNHEYGTPGAAGYRSYLDLPLHGVREVGGWRIYLVDSTCEEDECRAELAWLEGELQRDPAACTAVAMHHPRWSSGAHGPQDFLQDMWEVLVRRGVDLALAGHDHDYERFARLEETGHATEGTDREGDGTRQIVVGTGGKSFYELREQRTGSEYLQNERFGVLELTLRPDGYDWSFVDTDEEVLDAGSDTCSP